MSKYCVKSVAIINLYKLVQALHDTNNLNGFDFNFDQNFQNSTEFRVLNKYIHKKIT